MQCVDGGLKQRSRILRFCRQRRANEDRAIDGIAPVELDQSKKLPTRQGAILHERGAHQRALRRGTCARSIAAPARYSGVPFTAAPHCRAAPAKSPSCCSIWARSGASAVASLRRWRPSSRAARAVSRSRTSSAADDHSWKGDGSSGTRSAQRIVVSRQVRAPGVGVRPHGDLQDADAVAVHRQRPLHQRQQLGASVERPKHPLHPEQRPGIRRLGLQDRAEEGRLV